MKRDPLYTWDWTGVHQIVTKDFLYARVELSRDLSLIETKELRVPMHLADEEADRWATKRIKELRMETLLLGTSGT